MLNFPQPLANATDYPKPEINVTAQHHIYNYFHAPLKEASQFIQEGVYTKNGRSAIATIAKSLNLKSGDTILLPEFFCPAMVEPFVWLGLHVKFYKLHKTLVVDHEHFQSLIDENVKACLFVHFFGFNFDIKKSLSLAKKHNLIAIEDCAHSFFSKKLTVNDLCFDASICSLNKFFPCLDGGMYRLNKKRQTYSTFKPLKRDYKDEVTSILCFLGIDRYISFIKKMLVPQKIQPLATTKLHDLKRKFRYFNPEEITICCLKLTEWIVKSSDYEKIKKARVANYEFLYNGLKDSAFGQPLTDMEEGVVPYVFPFILNDENDFDYIRKQGLQILRWEEFHAATNDRIESYRKKLIQIPCHQNLTKHQIEQIILIVNKEKK